MMPIDLAQRHRGSLGGKLSTNDDQVGVRIAVAPDHAAKPAIQHLCWMLVNLMARQADEVSVIQLDIPSGVPRSTPLSPLIDPTQTDLIMALRSGLARINPSVLESSGRSVRSVTIRVGPGPVAASDLALVASADGWAGYLGTQAVDEVGHDDNPVGAYLAACLTAGEVFKFARNEHNFDSSSVEALWFDGVTLRHGPAFPGPGQLPAQVNLSSAILVGAGAVGTSLLQILYAFPSTRGVLTVVDHDVEGITDSNLNRCVLFGVDQIGLPKASTAAAAFASTQVEIVPVDDAWEAWYRRQGMPAIKLALSAVDSNHSRHAIQDAMPCRVLGASTNEMRAQLNAYDPIQGGPCLRCRNKPEPVLSDESIIAALRHLPVKERRRRALEFGIDPATLETYLSDPIRHCGKISGSTLHRFAGSDSAAEWSVGFVSVFAGVLLATELIKRTAPMMTPSLSGESNTYRFQFWHPERQSANRAIWTPPESECICQTPVFQQAWETMWAR